jgi:hypothetical protein
MVTKRNNKEVKLENLKVKPVNWRVVDPLIKKVKDSFVEQEKYLERENANENRTGCWFL